MLILVSAAILTVTSAAILAARFWRPRFGFAWLLASSGSLAAFFTALAAHPTGPQIFTLGSWQPRILLPVSPALLIDPVSWSLAMAVLALNLAAVLTEVQHFAADEHPGEHPLEIAAGLVLTAAAALAVTAGNLLSLLLMWTAIDLITAVIRLPRLESYRITETVLLALAARMGGTWLIIWAGLLNSAEGGPTALTTISTNTAALLIAALFLRVSLPLPVEAPHAPRSSGLIALGDLLPAAAVWTVAVRVAAANPPAFGPALIWIGALLSLYGGLRLIVAPSLALALPAWVLGISGWTAGCAVLGHPYAALAAAICGVLFGGLIRLAQVRPRTASVLLFTGALLFSGLPLTPAWPAVGLYAPPLHPVVLVYFAGYCALLIGFVRQAIRRAPPPPAAERWFWVIYPLGLAVLPVFALILAWNLRPGTPAGMPAWPGWIESSVGLVAVGAALVVTAFFYRRRRRIALTWNRSDRPEQLFSLFRSLFNFLRRHIHRIGWVLEGRAGLLWALLVLALLISLMVQVGGEPQP